MPRPTKRRRLDLVLYQPLHHVHPGARITLFAALRPLTGPPELYEAAGPARTECVQRFLHAGFVMTANAPGHWAQTMVGNVINEIAQRTDAAFWLERYQQGDVAEFAERAVLDKILSGAGFALDGLTSTIEAGEPRPV